MGYEWEVSVWKDGRYSPYWEGDNREDALAAMEKAAKEGYLCIKLEWRPRGA